MEFAVSENPYVLTSEDQDLKSNKLILQEPDWPMYDSQGITFSLEVGLLLLLLP